ncbi:MAG TPA: T9SS type A sorting domain-containing protein [Prolixibacteraceae bacterium]|nr:T9SS type A sorting domain-containing protein [Prolixibacteraceae bacterium]
MRQIKLKTGLLLLIVLIFTGLQAQKKLYIQAKDGTKSTFPLNEIRKVTFPSRTLIVYSNDGNTQTFPFSELRQARFTEWLTGNHSYDLQENNGLALFPNPVDNELTVKTQSESGESIEIRIIDVKGNMIYTQTSRTLPGNNHIKMQLSHLPKGLYVCRVTKGKKADTSKFLKN